MTHPVSTPNRFLLPTAAALIVAGALVLVLAWLQPDVTVNGVSDGGSAPPAALRNIEITALADPAAVEVLLDGAPAPVRRDGARFTLDASALPEGEHTLLVRSPDAAMPLPGFGTQIDFTVDATPPALVVDPVTATALDVSAEVRGHAQGADELLVGGVPYELDDGGAFTVTVPPGGADVDLLARDAEGNSA